MDFKPFEPPPTDYHGLAQGTGNEGGVSARALVEGVNKYLGFLFGAVKGAASAPSELESGAAEILAEAKAFHDNIAKLVSQLESRIAALEAKAPSPAPAPTVAATQTVAAAPALGGTASQGLAGTQPAAAPAPAPETKPPADEQAKPDPLADAIKNTTSAKQ